MTSDKTILIIDDDRNLRETLALIFRRAGYCVLSATDIERAFLPLQNHPCDVVIFDFNNPDNLLLESISQLQTFQPRMPIVVLTGNTPVDLPRGADEEKEFGFLEKPVDPIKILNYVAEFIHKS